MPKVLIGHVLFRFIGREAVVYLTEAIRERVNAFFQQTQKPPMRIIVYRDGVADGQFGDVSPFSF